MIKRAVLAGYAHVDPLTHGGWDGDCPGTANDVRRMAAKLGTAGIAVTQMLDQQATKAAFFAAVRKAWRTMQADDLFVMYLSGHGGQRKDTNGDEADGLDEMAIMWDVDTTDDEFWHLLCEAPLDLRILCIFDQCNSGTMARLVPRAATAPRSVGDLRASVIVFSGCADGKSSFGSDAGGEWTAQLIAADTDSATYKEWFDRARHAMPRNQVPIYSEYGNDPARLISFRSTKALA